MLFASDNWPGAHPAIAEALLHAASETVAPYGAGETDKAVEQRLCEIFERDVKVFFVATGTAANSLALASCTRPGAVMFCHEEAHVLHHEGGAVEFQTGGGKLVPVNSAQGERGRIMPQLLAKAIARYPADDVHVGQKTALSISQVSESGTIYSAEEIAGLCAIAHEHKMKVHMDGARFSNAVVASGSSPAELTWRAGIDILSLGGTKNGCFCAEAIVFFNPDDAAQLPQLRKRAANLFSKSNFIARQFDAWLKGGLWLDLATHANTMAGKLLQALGASDRIRPAWKTDASQLFLIMTDETAEKLRDAGARFYDWETPADMQAELAPDEKIRRFITSFATREDEIAEFAKLIS